VNPSGNHTDFLKVNDASDDGVLSSSNQFSARRIDCGRASIYGNAVYRPERSFTAGH
jgi:hypothetical protein